MSSVYRTKTTTETPQEAEQPQAEKQVGDVERFMEENVEVPYTDYEKTHGHPYVVDYYKLGDTWRDKLGGFEKEVTLIEDYFKDKIEQGKMQNTKEAVDEELKKMYRLCNIDKQERITMQIEKLSAYLEFLKKTEHINLNYYKYGYK